MLYSHLIFGLIFISSIGAVQENNCHLYSSQLYQGQTSLDIATANVQYLFLPQDSSRLYHMQACTQGVDLSKPPEINIAQWLDPKIPEYKAELAQTIFYYKARHSASERFQVCIQTEEMKAAPWKYTHSGQLLLDGTFGLCNHHLLLFIGLGID